MQRQETLRLFITIVIIWAVYQAKLQQNAVYSSRRGIENAILLHTLRRRRAARRQSRRRELAMRMHDMLTVIMLNRRRVRGCIPLEELTSSREVSSSRQEECCSSNMQPIRWRAAVIIGVVISQITNIRISSKSPDCLAVMETCISDLCKTEQRFFSGVCEVNDEGCQIKGSKVCNMTIQSILDQFPSLQGCMCAWEEELCSSIQALATQCHQKPAQQKRSSVVVDWRSSKLIGYVYDGTGSCLKQINVCVHDEVCNRYLVPLLHACSAEQCDSAHCQQVTHQFYAGMPYNVAEMLVMCECELWDQDCLLIKSTLQSGTCGDETWTCQEGVKHCLDDWHCRNLLKTFRAKCWNAEDTQCSDDDYRDDECIGQMDPALILGGAIECKLAFLATVGTALQYPCTCKGIYKDDLLKCNILHDILNNRSHFMIPEKGLSGPYNPPEINESEHGHKWATDFLIYAFAIVLLGGVVLLMPVVVFYIVWMVRRRDETKFHPPQKSNCVL